MSSIEVLIALFIAVGLPCATILVGIWLIVRRNK